MASVRCASRLVLLLLLAAAFPVASQPNSGTVTISWCSVFRTNAQPNPPWLLRQCVPFNCDLNTCGTTEAWGACQLAEQMVGQGLDFYTQRAGTPIGGAGLNATFGMSLMALNILAAFGDASPSMLCGDNSNMGVNMWRERRCSDPQYTQEDCRAATVVHACSCARTIGWSDRVADNCTHCGCYFKALRDRQVPIGEMDQALEAARSCLRASVPPPPPGRPVPPPRVQPPGRTGRTFADPYVSTFDGLRIDFMKVGEFLAVRAPETGTEAFEVQMRTAPWSGSSSVSMNTAVAARLGDDRLVLNAFTDPPLRVNGTPVPLAVGDSTVLASGATATRSSENLYQLSSAQGDSVLVTLHQPGTVDAFLDLDVTLGEPRTSLPIGLLGNGNGDPSDDTVPPGDHRLAAAESLFDYGPGESTSTFTDLDFPYTPTGLEVATPVQLEAAQADCLAAGVSDPSVLMQCANDLLSTGSTAFITSALAADGRIAAEEGQSVCAGLDPGFPCVATDSGPCLLQYDELENVICVPVAPATLDPPGEGGGTLE